ncbi:RraA family protein [Candidatus Latescibacterota bacterium]
MVKIYTLTKVIVFSIVLFSVLFISQPNAQIGVFTREDLIEYTPQWTGERFPDGRPKVPDEVIERLKTIFYDDAWSILQRNGYTFQDEIGWVSDFTYLPTQEIPVMVGRAATVRYLPVRPDVEEVNQKRNKAANRTGGNIGMATNELQEGDIAVVDMFGKRDGGIFAGGDISMQMHENGVKGLVIDGGGHDLDEVLYVPDFTTFAREFNATHQHDVMLMGINVPVRIGKVTVMPGDIVMGTREGVIFIPAHLAEEVSRGLD